MELEVILTELQPFKLYFSAFFLHCRVSSLCNQLLQLSMDFFKPCLLVVDIMKICMWVFDEARINFDGITAF